MSPRAVRSRSEREADVRGGQIVKGTAGRVKIMDGEDAGQIFKLHVLLVAWSSG